MERIELPLEVVDGTGAIGTVVAVMIKKGSGVPFEVKRGAFLDTFQEYVDPKDLEIARLLDIIKDLEKPQTTPRKRHLSKEEKEEIKVMVEKGIEVKPISVEYGISDTTIYKWIKEGSWDYKAKRGQDG